MLIYGCTTREQPNKRKANIMNKLKEKLHNNEVCLGTHVSLNDPVITELMGNVGFDYLWIDTEHTAIDLNCLQQHLIAARAACVPNAMICATWSFP